MTDKILDTKNLFLLLEFEPLIIMSALLGLSWIFYKIFLKKVSEERHRNLANHYKNILRHYLIMLALFATFSLLRQASEEWVESASRAAIYIGLVCFVWGILVFVKTCRLIILQYLFLGSMQHGVPVLIVNIFSLVLTVALIMWSATQLFHVQIAPLVATSAVFSIILGLALQDTIGNLFAGVSLQFDKSFEIGDWLEVFAGSQKIVGQVKEISWRATVLIGWSEEVITIPNRVLAGSQISNFSKSGNPIIRAQNFRLHYSVDSEKVKHLLLESLRALPNVRQTPAPGVYISESTDSWLNFRLYYFIDNYGSQFGIGDQVLDSALSTLQKNGIQTASQRMTVTLEKNEKSI